MEKLYLIGGDLGPFNASLPIEVPLWLALNLCQRHKCRVQPPDWMNIQTLDLKKQEEQENKFFTVMPSSYYMEVTQLLLRHCLSDIPHADQVSALVKDIWDLRMAKLRTSIDAFIKSDSSHAKLNHLTLMELNTVRPFLTAALDQMQALRSNLTIAPLSSQSQD